MRSTAADISRGGAQANGPPKEGIAAKTEYSTDSGHHLQDSDQVYDEE
ncbi:MAG: hypothetical protein WB869_14150 [Candidatus Acidiferrales bacterium]